jgi:hypothetical protein
MIFGAYRGAEGLAGPRQTLLAYVLAQTDLGLENCEILQTHSGRIRIRPQAPPHQGASGHTRLSTDAHDPGSARPAQIRRRSPPTAWNEGRAPSLGGGCLFSSRAVPGAGGRPLSAAFVRSA